MFQQKKTTNSAKDISGKIKSSDLRGMFLSGPEESLPSSATNCPKTQGVSLFTNNK